MKISTEQLQLFFKNFCDHVGLNSGEVDVAYSNYKKSIYLRWGIEVDYLRTLSTENPKEFFDKVFVPIIKNIENSEAVKNALYELDKKNLELEEKLKFLQLEINKLKPFETYYNLHFKMTHGDK